MILAIDIGNSNIVIGGVQGDEIIFEARLRTETTKTSDQYCVDLKILLDVYKVDTQSIEGSIIASVVPQVLDGCEKTDRQAEPCGRSGTENRPEYPPGESQSNRC